MDNETNVEVQKEEATIVETKPSLKERFLGSRPVKFVRRHKVGVATGVIATAAAGAAAVMAKRYDATGEVPFDADAIVEALPIEE